MSLNFNSDIDECKLEIYECDLNALCINTEGSYDCRCKTGYVEEGGFCTGENIK